MTTIVYRNGTMVGDSRAYSGGSRPIGRKVKVERLQDGSLVGVSCNIPGGAETVREWVKAGKPKGFDLPENFTVLHALPNGDVYYACDTHHVTGPLHGEFFSIGSGCEFAIGAMERGANAVQACSVACKHDVWSDGPIYAVAHDMHGRWRFGDVAP